MVETYWQMFVLHCCSSLAAFPVFTPLIGQIFHRGLLLPSIVIFFSFCTAWAKQQSPATKPQQVAVEIQRRQLPTFKHWAGLFGWWSRRHILGMTLFWHQHSPSQTVLSLTYTWGLWGGLGWKRVSLITLFNQSVLVQGRNGIITHYVELKNICLFFPPPCRASCKFPHCCWKVLLRTSPHPPPLPVCCYPSQSKKGKLKACTFSVTKIKC